MNVESGNTEQSADEAARETAQKPTPGKSRGGLVFITLLLALAAIGFSGYNYQNIVLLQTPADTGLEDSVTRLDRRLAELDRRLSSLNSSMAETREEIDRLMEGQANNTDSLETLFEMQGRDNNAWALAEVENLLIMANHRLTLERDVETTLASLEAANARLVGLGDPGLFPVRRQLTSDINALNAVDVVDITGVSLYLSDYLDRVPNLPLKQTELIAEALDSYEEDEQAPAWRRLLSAVWQEFRGMFVITRTGSEATATLLPDEAYFVYQNLRLQLETARLAIVRRDTENLRASMEIIRSWLTTYFDTDDNDVANLMNTTERMSRLELDPDLPDISSSLESLRAYLRERPETSPADQEMQSQ